MWEFLLNARAGFPPCGCMPLPKTSFWIVHLVHLCLLEPRPQPGPKEGFSDCPSVNGMTLLCLGLLICEAAIINGIDFVAFTVKGQ